MKRLLVFKSITCAPCKSLSDMMKVTNLNVDQITTIDSSCSRDMFIEYNVRSVPTSIILVDNEEVSRLTGYKDKDSYLSFINQV